MFLGSDVHVPADPDSLTQNVTGKLLPKLKNGSTRLAVT